MLRRQLCLDTGAHGRDIDWLNVLLVSRSTLNERPANFARRILRLFLLTSSWWCLNDINVLSTKTKNSISYHSRIIPSDARSGHKSISSIVLSTFWGILIPYLESHWSRLAMSEWSTFSARRSTLDSGRSKPADDDGQSSANGNAGKPSARPSSKLCAGDARDGLP